MPSVAACVFCLVLTSQVLWASAGVIRTSKEAQSVEADGAVKPIKRHDHASSLMAMSVSASAQTDKIDMPEMSSDEILEMKVQGMLRDVEDPRNVKHFTTLQVAETGQTRQQHKKEKKKALYKAEEKHMASAKKSVLPLKRRTMVTSGQCSEQVEGAVVRDASWWADLMGFKMDHCMCPGNTVISGESTLCKRLQNGFQQYFELDSDLVNEHCKCEFKSGCGIAVSSVDDLLPANHEAKGLPAPVVVGTPANVDTGIKELDEGLYGVWWMKDNPLPEELATFAGTFSHLSGKNAAASDANNWPLAFGTKPNLANHWAFCNTFLGRHFQMRFELIEPMSGNFTMQGANNGEVDNPLREQFGVWVDKWGFDKLTEHEWNRTTIFQKKSPWPNSEYTLTRIIDQNGEKTDYFQEFKDYMKGGTLAVWDSDDLCKRKCMLAGDSCGDCHDCCEGGTNSFGKSGFPKSDCPYAVEVEATDDRCSAVVKGAIKRSGSLFSDAATDCQCPEGTVIRGSSAACQAMDKRYDMFFNFKDLDGAGCKCQYKEGCGFVKVTAEDILPAKALEKGIPTPVIVGNSDNIDTGVPELDQELFGVWWMRDNPVPEELASFAGAHSRLTGKQQTTVDWPLKVDVPNSLARKWSWPDTWMAHKAILPQYTSAIDNTNSFNFKTTTDATIETGLTDQFGVWVDYWGFEKIADNVWNRPTVFQPHSPWPDTNYTLTRIIDKDGQPTDYFEVFKKYMRDNMNNAALIVWDTDDACKRQCMLNGGSCTACHEQCGEPLKGQLRVKVIGARNLPEEEWCTMWFRVRCKADAFVKVKVGEEEHTSKRIDEDVSPTWNFETEFSVDEATSTVTLDVYEHDWGYKADDHLGNVKVNFRDLQAGQEVTFDKGFSGRQGAVKFSLTWVP